MHLNTNIRMEARPVITVLTFNSFPIYVYSQLEIEAEHDMPWPGSRLRFCSQRGCALASSEGAAWTYAYALASETVSGWTKPASAALSVGCPACLKQHHKGSDVSVPWMDAAKRFLHDLHTKPTICKIQTFAKLQEVLNISACVAISRGLLLR